MRTAVIYIIFLIAGFIGGISWLALDENVQFQTGSKYVITPQYYAETCEEICVYNVSRELDSICSQSKTKVKTL